MMRIRSGMIIRRWCWCLLIILIAAGGYSQNQLEGKIIGVLPFTPEGISEDETLIIAKAVRDALGTSGKGSVSSEIMEALASISCDDSKQWNIEECVIAVGKKLNAAYVLGGSIVVVDSQCTIQPVLYDVEKKVKVWSTKYSITGGPEDIYRQIPKKIAQDISFTPEAKTEPATEKSSPVSNDSVAGSIVTETVTAGVESQVEPAVEQQSSPKGNTEVENTVSVSSPDYCLVRGLTIGLGGIMTLIRPEREQSLGGFLLSVIYPTGEHTQIRVKAGLPLSRNPDINDIITNVQPDPYGSAEYDWMWRYFGITAGLGYMYMGRFSKNDYWRYYAEYDDINYESKYYKIKSSESYDAKHAINAVFGLRAGHPDRGFYGRFSWPLAFTVSGDEANQFFMEYSVFGVFGWKKSKIGVGFMGWYKHREPDPKDSSSIVSTKDSIGFDEFDAHFLRDERMTNEISLLFPCLRYARTVGEHLVVSLTFELGGTLLPRSFLPDFFGYQQLDYGDSMMENDLEDDRNWWKPSAGLNVVYSFGLLTSPHFFDGTF